MPDAKAILRTKFIRLDGAIIEIVIWEVDQPIPPCTHRYKYRLYFGADGVCFVRYDNERGKGDHRHLGGVESAYAFTTTQQLLEDFERDINNWRQP